MYIPHLFLLIFLILICEYVFIDFRDRGRGVGENIDVREKHQLVASCTHPDGGLNLKPRYVP